MMGFVLDKMKKFVNFILVINEHISGSDEELLTSIRRQYNNEVYTIMAFY